MVETSLLIGLIGLTIFVGYLASIFFDKTKIPDVLLLIAMGMILGPITGIIDGSLIIDLAPLIGTIALIIIVFDGSTKLNFFEVLDELPESIWFTFVVSGLTAVFVSVVIVFGLGMSFPLGLLAGVIVAGTSYEIIVPLVSKLTVKEKAKTLLNLESALNDIITIIGLVALFEYLSQSGGKQLDPLQLLIASFSIAIFVGIISGILWLKVLQNYKGKPFEYLLTLAFVFFLYSFTEAMKGNGITSILVFGLVLGNSQALARLFKSQEEFGLDAAVTNFNSEVSFFVRTMFFVYMGVVFRLDAITATIMLTAFFMFLASLAARYVAVELLIRANPALKDSQLILLAMLPRGLATAVLASLAVSQGIDFPNIIEIVLVFMLFTNIFATAAAYYFETQVAPKPAPSSRKRES